MALNAYLTDVRGDQVGPVPGSVTQNGREGWIQVYGYSHPIGIQNFVGLRPHRPITITKPIDRATPLLATAWAMRDVLHDSVLRCFRPTPMGTEEEFFRIELTDARVIEIRHELLNTRYPENRPLVPREQVSFTYRSIQWTGFGASANDEWEHPRF
ncbi:MAG: type VI secretion system tube protein TssD [Sandaracinaceae bacterium]